MLAAQNAIQREIGHKYKTLLARSLKTAQNETGIQSTFVHIYNVAQCIFYDIDNIKSLIYEQSSNRTQ